MFYLIAYWLSNSSGQIHYKMVKWLSDNIHSFVKIIVMIQNLHLKKIKFTSQQSRADDLMAKRDLSIASAKNIQ